MLIGAFRQHLTMTYTLITPIDVVHKTFNSTKLVEFKTNELSTKKEGTHASMNVDHGERR
jgi:hypothetical protein